MHIWLGSTSPPATAMQRSWQMACKREVVQGPWKYCISSGLLREHMLGIPGCFPGDIMHWGSLNWTELVLALFRGTLQCEKPDSKDNWAWAVLKDEIWKAHGEAVAAATPYLPGSFDRLPHNPAEKNSSSYKAWEYLLYIVICIGPAALYSQWTMERPIGNLGQEIKLHSNPYVNLSERGLWRSQVNALKAMLPDLNPETKKLPRGSIDLGDRYVLLRARTSTDTFSKAKQDVSYVIT
ncbi:hypothetical protein B0H17DRAFT_1140107 [Mycena rosella]|uniref:Uncharacterized protein n=1 Tax=Mycena rosella TaxID=1033263 RepID=A0AAD7D396_MYCRO|nr:hypothetical protein B0H17DRAFT_1140107 [Mycena rosella]